MQLAFSNHKWYVPSLGIIPGSDMQPVPAPLDSLTGYPFFILKIRKLKPKDADTQEAWGGNEAHKGN